MVEMGLEDQPQTPKKTIVSRVQEKVQGFRWVGELNAAKYNRIWTYCTWYFRIRVVGNHWEIQAVWIWCFKMSVTVHLSTQSNNPEDVNMKEMLLKGHYLYVYETNWKYSYFNEERQLYVMIMIMIFPNNYRTTFQDIWAFASSRDLWLESSYVNISCQNSHRKRYLRVSQGLYTRSNYLPVRVTVIRPFIVRGIFPAFLAQLIDKHFDVCS
jgi:hypothetical protein